MFLTFEGIEGSGKTVQITRLAGFLRKRGLSVVRTREPGGTRTGDAIRRIFLGPAGEALDPWTELFLMEAARAQHLAEVVRPALESGRSVLCDRFTDSTIAYQGGALGLPLPVIRGLHRLPGLRPYPDFTILLDLEVHEGLRRARGRNAAGGRPHRESRIDSESAAFHARVRLSYLSLARRDRRRVALIDAAGSPGEVAARVRRLVLARFPTLLS